jgi:hypothetical protein
VAFSGCTTPVPDACSGSALSGGISAIWSSWQGLVGVGAVLVVTFSAVVYLLSGLLNHRGLIVWSKNQLYESLATVVLAVFAVSIMGFACSIDVGFIGADCGGTGCSAIASAQYYLEQFRDTMSTGFYTMMVANMLFAAWASTKIAMVVGGLGPIISYGAGFATVSQQLSTVLILTATAQLITMSELVLLQIFAKMFGLFIIAGIVLRSFGITRGLGGALIAISLGFYLVYPLSIVLFYSMLGGDLHANVEEMRAVTIPSENPTSQQGAGASALDFIYEFTESFWAFIAYLVIGAVFVPFVVFVIAVSFIKGLSQILGEEVDVGNLTRLV